MLTLKRRRKRRVPPRRGRGAILGLFFCCAQCSILAVVVSTRPAVSCRCDCGVQRRFRCHPCIMRRQYLQGFAPHFFR
jgi:hypothetical protein